jgi:hypothetical protein
LELGLAIHQQEESERKADNGRKIKLGAAIIGMMKRDATLLTRMEAAIKSGFASRKVDRQHFRLDSPLTWFDELREEAHEEAASAPAAPAAGAASKPAATPKPASTPVAAGASAAAGAGPTVPRANGAPANGTATA